MPLSSIAEFFLQPLIELLLQIAGYFTARVLVPMVTLGHIRVEPHGRKFVKPGLGRIQRRPGGGLLMEMELAALIGLLFWALVGVAIFFAYRT